MAKGQPKEQRVSRSKLPDIPKNLPKPSKGRNLTNAQKLKVATVVCKIYATDQHTLQTCLEAVGIKSDNTWYNWCDQIAEIAEAYQDAIKEKDKVYRGRLRQRARTSLEKMVEGYVVATREVMYEYIVITDKDGKVTGRKKVAIGEKVKEHYVKPSPTLIQYVLNNLDSGNFERNPERIPVESDRVDIPRFEWVEEVDYEEWVEENTTDAEVE